MSYGDADSNKPIKSKMIVFRATPSEVAIIKDNARRKGMTLSRYMRSRCLFDKN